MFFDLEAHEEPLGTPWASHGAAVASQGRPTGVPWGARVAPMGHQWGAMGSHGCSMRPHWPLMGPDGPLGTSLRHLGPCCEALWTSVGPACSHLGLAMGQMGFSWDPPWDVLVPCCAILRSLLGALCTSLEPACCHLGPTWGPRVSPWAFLAPS